MARNTINIAVLLYGQPRFVKENIRNIKKEFTFHNKDIGEVDFFCHFWDEVGYNVIDDIEQNYEDVNLELIKQILQPKKMLIEDQREIHTEAETLCEYIKLADKHIRKPENNYKNINEINDSSSLIGLLGQFTSIKKVTTLLTEYEQENNIKYDLVIRSRTDLKFNPQEMYISEDQYWRDKYVYYVEFFRFNKQRGIYGEGLQMWNTPERQEDDRIKPAKITPLNRVTFDKNKPFFHGIRADVHEVTKCTLHLKDWVIYGDNESMKTLNNQLYFNFLDMIHKDLSYINSNNLTYEWGAAELVTGNTIVNNNLFTTRIKLDWPNNVDIWTRFFKIQKRNREKELHIKQGDAQAQVIYSDENMDRAFYKLLIPKPRHIPPCMQ
jgi:hypothetical protein